MNNKISALCLILFLIFLTPSFAFAKKKCPLYTINKTAENIYVIEVNDLQGGHYLIPYVSDTLETNIDIYKKTGAKFSVNTGFFDFINQKTVSYVTVHGKVVANPEDNENFMKNKTLQPYIDKILNRSEFRILKTEDKKIIYDIAPHNDPIPENMTLIHSVQGGPALLPEVRTEEECFVIKKDGKIIRESAFPNIKRARTALGIKNNKVYIFVATNESPLTLNELAELTRKTGMEKALGFDGGGSTSFDDKELHIISEGENGRKVKSFLLLF